jgi:hypothetical protein
MAMRKRMWLFSAAFFGTGLPILALAVEYQMIWVLLLWFVLFGVVQFVVFRCPHCGKVAVFTPSGMATPMVGGQCRYCGKEY